MCRSVISGLAATFVLCGSQIVGAEPPRQGKSEEQRAKEALQRLKERGAVHKDTRAEPGSKPTNPAAQPEPNVPKGPSHKTTTKPKTAPGKADRLGNGGKQPPSSATRDRPHAKQQRASNRQAKGHRASGRKAKGQRTSGSKAKRPKTHRIPSRKAKGHQTSGGKARAQRTSGSEAKRAKTHRIPSRKATVRRRGPDPAAPPARERPPRKRPR